MTSQGPALSPLGAKNKLGLGNAKPAESDGQKILAVEVHKTGLVHPVESEHGTEVRHGSVAWASCGMAEMDFYAEGREQAKAMLEEHADGCQWDNAHSVSVQGDCYLVRPTAR
jgi:hypothetical protein